MSDDLREIERKELALSRLRSIAQFIMRDGCGEWEAISGAYQYETARFVDDLVTALALATPALCAARATGDQQPQQQADSNGGNQ